MNKEIKKKYEKKQKDLLKFKIDLANEYDKTKNENTLKSFYKVCGKIELLEKILIDLKGGF